MPHRAAHVYSFRITVLPIVADFSLCVRFFGILLAFFCRSLFQTSLEKSEHFFVHFLGCLNLVFASHTAAKLA